MLKVYICIWFIKSIPNQTLIMKVEALLFIQPSYFWTFHFHIINLYHINLESDNNYHR